MYVALVIHNAMRMRHIVASPPLSYFSILSQNLCDLRKRWNLLNMSRELPFYIQLLSETFLILGRTGRDMTKNVYWSSCKVPVILVRFFMKLKFYRQFLGKYSNIKFHENSSSGSQVVPCGQMDGWQTWSYKSLFVILRTRQKMSLVCWWAAWIPCNSVELLLFHQRRWIDRH